MSSSFNSEIMDDELSTVLLNLTPDDPRYTSLEGWLDLTPEAQAAVQLRYADPANWNEPKQHTCVSEHYATYVCNYCYKFVASIDMSLVLTRPLRSDTFHRIHKRNCPQSNSNKIKDLTNLVQNLTDTIQSLNLEIESLKLRIQQIEEDVRTRTFVSMSNLLNLDFDT